MLEKTFALLNDIPGGTYVPDEKKCYDDAEIEQLSQILSVCSGRHRKSEKSCSKPG